MGAVATGGDQSTIYDGGVPYTVHVFTTSGTLVLSTQQEVECLLVGGGGAGGRANDGGGGGAGQVLHQTITVPAGEYTIVIGDGAPAGQTDYTTVINGEDSTFYTLTAHGGGTGGMGGGGGDAIAHDGQDGGSGGGGGGTWAYSYGNPDPGSAIYGSYGNDGGSGYNTADTGGRSAGGGGGANSVGQSATSSNGGDGGDGVLINIRNVDEYFGGGGGGGTNSSSGRGLGGAGGGGDGGDDGHTPIAGVSNTGGGGGGGRETQNGAAGGSGIIILKVPFVLYKVTGTVKENNSPVLRTLRLYREFDGVLMDETTSSGVGGSYILRTSYDDAHYVVCLDDSAGQNYNHLVQKNVEIEEI